MVKLGYNILYVADVERAVVFYETAFGFQRKFITPEKDYAELITGDTTLSFASHGLANSNLRDGFMESNRLNPAFGIELGFVTDNVEETYAKALEAGAMEAEPPKQKPWGQTVAYVRDLDGFLLEICSPMGD